MPRVPCKLFAIAIVASAPPPALAEGVVVGEGRVKTDAGEFVTHAGQSWACLGAPWQEAGTGPGGLGTRYACAGTLLDTAAYTAVSAGTTAVALADLNAAVEGVAADVARNAEATEALRGWIEAQVHGSNKLLYDTVAARFDALPARLLANRAFADAIARLRAEVLGAVAAAGNPPPGRR